MRAHAFGTSRVNSQRHALKKKIIFFIMRDAMPSPHGVWFIVRIHQGYIPFSVSHRLFQDMEDATTLTAIIGDPFQPLAIGKRLVFSLRAIVA